MTALPNISTGRVGEPLPRSLRNMLFGASVDAECESTLQFQTNVDRAWAVMLHDRGLASTSDVARFLGALDELDVTRFAALRGREPVRGAFLLYEHVLANEMGVRLASDLQRARSRNDVNATLLRMRMRRPLTRLCVQTLRLVVAMRRIASRTGSHVMPVYTHGQQALAGTAGHIFAAAAEELLLDADGLWGCWDDLQICPLGAGAVCGTALPIDTRLVSDLLGFDAPAANSLRAVASRRVVLVTLSTVAMLAVTLSRIGADLMTWCSDELRFARLPDRLVGTSSHMPQKRNLYLLEHVQSRASSALGGLVTAAAAMTSKPFSNSVAVGTDAVRSVWTPLGDAADAVVILRTILEGIELDREAMERRARNGATCASDLAELLVERGSTFREAHHAVGDLVSQAERDGTKFIETAAALARDLGLANPELVIDPTTSARRREFGGGTGPASLARQLDAHRQSTEVLRTRLRTVRRRHRDAASRLLATTRALIRPIPNPIQLRGDES